MEKVKQMYCTAYLSATTAPSAATATRQPQNTCVEKCLNELLYDGQPRPTCSTCPYDCLICNIYGKCLS
jgi:hypothetical protein